MGDFSQPLPLRGILSADSGLGPRRMTGLIHGNSARALNELEGTTGREIWYRAWDIRISFETSYLARLAYVHKNPVKHGISRTPENYPWCSAGWLLREGHEPFVKTILSFQTDQVRVRDDFEVGDFDIES